MPVPTEGVRPCGVTNAVDAPLYMLETRRVKSWGKTQEIEYTGQLSVVRRGEGTLEVHVAEDDILLVGVSVLQHRG